MAQQQSHDLAGDRPQPLFVTTRWSVVLAARNKASPDAAQALETLCRTYWYPLYVYVRSSGYSPPDAQDLTQEFFSRLLSKDYLRAVVREKGRFRTFLRMALKRFLAAEWERRHAQKRGGGLTPLPFDTTVAEQRFIEECADRLAPDQIYDRRWALALLGEAAARLEQDYTQAGKAAELRHLKPYLTAERGGIPYGEISAALQTTEAAARVAVHRLRKRFRELFREVLADTVSAPEEVDGELRYMLEVLGRG